MNAPTIVKIGTDSLGNFRESEKVNKLVQTIANKTRDGQHVLLVTSGAVQFGREVLSVTKTEHENPQVLAALGWGPLMSAYGEKFHAVGLHTAGFLVTHADLEDHSSRANEFMRTIEGAWSLGVIPIVNENDPISTEEMREVGRGCDNDQNAFLLARIFRAHLLILITNTNGVYRDIGDSCSRIASIESSRIDENYIRGLCNGKSLSGTGGMASKLQIGHEAGAIGIDTHIGDGIHSGLHDLFSGGTNILSETQKGSF